MTYQLTELAIEFLPQATLLILGWISREAYRLSKSVNEVEAHAKRNRELIKGLHDLNDITDAINKKSVKS